jgi:predicted protein tyrosine phosphatase
MEDRQANEHNSRIVSDFRTTVAHKTLYVLDIPDEYKYMDPDLVEQLQVSVAAILGLER